MTAMAQATTEVENEIKDLLGADGYKQMQQLQQEQSIKQMVGQQLVPEMSGAGMPVTPDQIDALAKMQAGLFSPSNPGFRDLLRQPPDPVTGLSGRDQALIGGSSADPVPRATSSLPTGQDRRRTGTGAYAAGDAAIGSDAWGAMATGAGTYSGGTAIISGNALNVGGPTGEAPQTVTGPGTGTLILGPGN